MVVIREISIKKCGVGTHHLDTNWELLLGYVQRWWIKISLEKTQTKMNPNGGLSNVLGSSTSYPSSLKNLKNAEWVIIVFAICAIQTLVDNDKHSVSVNIIWNKSKHSMPQGCAMKLALLTNVQRGWISVYAYGVEGVL